jgi:CxxC motif-containing protein (DUF1111 family)
MIRRLLPAAILFGLVLAAAGAWAQRAAQDPGVRGGAAAAGAALAGLTPGQGAVFAAGLEAFEGAENVEDGLGPRFNLDSCGGCHSQPAMGGTSPGVNPQVAVASAFGATNKIPSFITLNGPVREARFKQRPDGSPDGGVHALFVISGRSDAPGCAIEQPDFEAELARNNVIFRIPTPVFGAGLIEQIPDATILANLAANAAKKTALGIRGRPHRTQPTGDPNRSGNDGTISRFGWKAQNKSLLLFSGEAYNVEMGISNELFPNERDDTASCHFAPMPNDVTNTDGTGMLDGVNDMARFAFFMRFLAAPTPASAFPGASADSIRRGRRWFGEIGCAHCHTPTLQTGWSTVEALNKKAVPLFSDLALHAMGAGLADDIVQGDAAGDEFRTAPLWGLGQRIFFLHDGRTSDLAEAIRAHRSARSGRYRASEANGSVERYDRLSEAQKQDLLNFLRSL